MERTKATQKKYIRNKSVYSMDTTAEFNIKKKDFDEARVDNKNGDGLVFGISASSSRQSWNWSGGCGMKMIYGRRALEAFIYLRFKKLG